LGDIDRLRPEAEYRDVGKLKVPYSSIDLNGHVNNTEYVKWGVDALRRFDKVGIDPGSFQISYNAEVFEGEELNLMVVENERSGYSIKGTRSSDGKNAFLMKILS
jgi:acyl-ACP thioesterase